MRYSPFLVCTLIACSSLAAPQKVTVRLKPTAGKTYAYDVSVQLSSRGSAGSSNISQTGKLDVKAASVGSSVTLLSTFTDVKVTMPADSRLKKQAGQIGRSMWAKDIRSVLDAQAKLLSLGGKNAGLLQALSPQMGQGFPGIPWFATAAVGTGSQWSTSVDFAKLMRGAAPGVAGSQSKVPLTMKVIGVETMSGRKAIRIKSVLKGSLTSKTKVKNLEATATTTVDAISESWIELASGMPIESHGTIVTSVKFGEQSSTHTSKVKIVAR